MNQLPVRNEFFPRHQLDRFGEIGIERVMEEERQEFSRELEFEEV